MRSDQHLSEAPSIATWTNRKPEVMVQVVELYKMVLGLKKKTFWPSAKNVSVALVHDLSRAQWAPPNGQWPITEGSDDADTFICRYFRQVLQTVSTIQVVYPALTREFLRSNQVRICQSWFKRHIFWTWSSILAAVLHKNQNQNEQLWTGDQRRGKTDLHHRWHEHQPISGFKQSPFPFHSESVEL